MPARNPTCEQEHPPPARLRRKMLVSRPRLWQLPSLDATLGFTPESIGRSGILHSLGPSRFSPGSDTTMRRLFRLPRAAAVLLALGLLAQFTLPGRSEEPQSLPRDQQIAEIEKQIGELNKKLNELKAAPNNHTTAAAAAPTLPP